MNEPDYDRWLDRPYEDEQQRQDEIENETDDQDDEFTLGDYLTQQALAESKRDEEVEDDEPGEWDPCRICFTHPCECFPDDDPCA